MKLKNYFGILLAIIVFTSSSPMSWVTFYGKKPIQINRNNKLITVFWNLPSKEEDINNKIEKRIGKIRERENFISDTVLFQSNNNLYLGRRTYIIHFFKTINEKNDFFKQDTVTTASFDSLFSSPNFNQRFNSIKKKMKIKKVFTTLPEFLNYKNVQVFYSDSTVFKVNKFEFVFNDWGRLDTIYINK